MKTHLSPRTEIFIESNMSKQYDPTNQIVFNISTTVIPCISNIFEEPFYNLQLLLRRCMALIVKRSLGWSSSTEKLSRLSILSATMSELALSFALESETS